MELYAAIDLHSNNSMLVVLDKDDHVILERRLPNDLERIRLALAPHRESIRGIAVESTYNLRSVGNSGVQRVKRRVDFHNIAA